MRNEPVYRHLRTAQGIGPLTARAFRAIIDRPELPAIPRCRGRLFAPHVQGLVWGQSTPAERESLAASFAGGIAGSHGVVRQRGYDVSGALSYSIKPPFHAYSLYHRRDGSYAHRGEALSLARQRLHRFTWPQVIFGVGEGEAILAAAWADLDRVRRFRARRWGEDAQW